MNKTIIEQFELLVKNLYFKKNEMSNISFKINSFKKTIEIIENLDFEIKNISQLKSIKGIGKGTLDRIKQILDNGFLQELKSNKENTIEKEKEDKNKEEFEKLLNVTGIGPAKAKKLLEENITLEKLLNNPKKDILNNLTHHQIVGLKYYYDIMKRIDSSIIEKIEKYLKKFDFNFNICGSFRREKDDSGDIDILIKKSKKNSSLKDIVNLLVKDKFLVDHLTECGETKYMGICKIPNYHSMRIDIRLVSSESYPFALLYFTGSKKTNTFMRNTAIKAGYKLNEYGLYDKDNNSISLKSEKDIFTFLQLPYLEPNKR